MSETLQMLRKRIDSIKHEVAEIDRLCGQMAGEPPPSPQEILRRRREEANRDKERMREILAQTAEEMGLEGDLIPVEELRRRIQEGGVKPEENLLSRGIIAAREE